MIDMIDMIDILFSEGGSVKSYDLPVVERQPFV